METEGLVPAIRRPKGERLNRLIESITSLGALLIPISAIVVGGVVAVTRMILQHQERIAKIERGIDPDVSRAK